MNKTLERVAVVLSKTNGRDKVTHNKKSFFEDVPNHSIFRQNARWNGEGLEVQSLDEIGFLFDVANKISNELR